MATLRDYQPDDLVRCQELINQAWDFDGNIAHPEVAALAKDIYVNGSLAESRHYRVVEDDGVVLGLLFGAAGVADKFPNGYGGVVGSLRVLLRLLRVRNWSFAEKRRWIATIRAHEVARAEVNRRSDSEITLLAVDEAARGRGLGGQLLAEYLEVCRSLGKARVTVETDVLSNFGFYEHNGFVRLGQFDSPMTELFSGGSGETYVYELRL
jgi:GNAT superfamily N-acetyltransferase